MTIPTRSRWTTLFALPVVILTAALIVAACGSDTDTSTQQKDAETDDSTGDDSTKKDSKKTTADAPTLNMSFPESLTGGVLATALINAASHNGPQCFFEGTGSENPFRNGYFMTKFLVSQAATWMCMTDFLMTVAATIPIPADGTVVDISDPNDPGGPTGLSIEAVSSTQTTIRLYFDGINTTPGLFLSWNIGTSLTQGRLILGGDIFNGDADPSGPTDMRMDFEIASDTKIAELFFQFPTSNPHKVSGFRVLVTKNLDGSYPTFTALGLLDMSGQPWAAFDPNFPASIITATPDLRMYTVSDDLGSGAAIAAFTDIAFGFDLGALFPGEHLGYYLFTKTDKYFFNAAGASEWIDKAITAASYETGITPMAPRPVIEFALFGSVTGTIDNCVAGINTDCVDLLNGIFTIDSGLGFEINSGGDPSDQRSSIINAVTSIDYLQSPYPDGFTSWSGVFDRTFTPTN